jgi:hypothetical protein
MLMPENLDQNLFKISVQDMHEVFLRWNAAKIFSESFLRCFGEKNIASKRLI